MQPIYMIMIYYWDKKLKKRLQVLEADLITIRKNIDFDVSSSKDAFIQNVFQMIVITLFSVINHYHINVLYLFWDILYKTKSQILFFFTAKLKFELGLSCLYFY